MKRFLILIMPLMFACGNHAMKGYVNKSFELKNKLGVVSFLLPSEFDTSYSWTNYSDAQCSGKEEFRFANKKFSLLRESGMFYNEIPDSCYQVTFSQPRYSDCNFSEEMTLVDLLDSWVEKDKLLGGSSECNVLGIIGIHGRDFAVLTYKDVISGKRSEALLALTILKGQLLEISYYCWAKDCNGFLDKMMTSLESIVIEEPPNPK